MPIVRSLNNGKAARCNDNYKVNQSGNKRKEKVYHAVIKFMSIGQRSITYADLANRLDIDVSIVEYYFKKLVAVGAINLEVKDNV